jgi:hypothetical protein
VHRKSTVKSFYCGFPSHLGVMRREKFREPILIELADCRLAAKTGKFNLNGKEYPSGDRWSSTLSEVWTMMATAR